MKILLLSLVFVFFLFLRFINPDFPPFTSDEAEISYRMYSLVNFSKDELGRKTPFLFNSNEDYKLPFAYYFSALGMFFGTNRFTASLASLFFGVIIIFLVIKITKRFNNNPTFCLFAAISAGISPVLVYLSRVPNEALLLSALYLLLFYFTALTLVPIAGIFIAIIILLTSKYAWFILPFFLSYTLFILNKQASRKDRIIVVAVVSVLSITSFLLFLQIPQGLRSMMENNLTIFSSIEIQNGINALRGHGLKENILPLIDRFYFNKLIFLYVGLLHWVSSLSLGWFFGQIDKDGIYGFINMGLWQKIMIVPFLMGVLYAIREKRKEVILLPIFAILVLPNFFTYPEFRKELIITIFPFSIFLIALGFLKIQNHARVLIIIFAVLELLYSLLVIMPQEKVLAKSRPVWVKSLVQDLYQDSLNSRVFVSDDIVPDIMAYIHWYGKQEPQKSVENLDYPYKFKQTSFTKNIKIIGFDNEFHSCEGSKISVLYLSARDLKKAGIDLRESTKIYEDNLTNKISYKVENKLCIK